MQGSAERGRRWVRAVLALAVVLLVVFGVVGEYVLRHAEPMVRERIVARLSARFGVPVELDGVRISLLRGIEVSGTGLRIPFRAGVGSGAYPMIAVRRFAFRTSFYGVLHAARHIPSVRVEGVEVHVPTAGERDALLGGGNGGLGPGGAGIGTVTIGELRCEDVKVYLEPGKVGGAATLLAIERLRLGDVGVGASMPFEVELTNPKPRGLIRASGHVGPVAGELRQLPVEGDYRFKNARLGDIRGIGGTLQSTGRFAGVVGRIGVEGTTETPDFSLATAGHPMPLATKFQAVVDGTSGDVALQRVEARLGRSVFTTVGTIVGVPGRGHDVQLRVDVGNGRIEDFLRLAVRTAPPVLNGALRMGVRVHIPPGAGAAPVPQRMAVEGGFGISGVQLGNPRWQGRVNELSARAQGRPQAAAAGGRDPRAEGKSGLTANVDLSGGVLSVTGLQYTVPGAVVLLNGVYSLDGRLFEFKGKVRTEATASAMVGGWKGMLLSPLDGLLKKNGAGVELPVEIEGTGGEIHVGLAMAGTDDSLQAMLADAERKRQAQGELSAARGASAAADAEDAAAARAPTLEAAEAAHAAAVRHRAEAMRRAEGAQAPRR